MRRRAFLPGLLAAGALLAALPPGAKGLAQTARRAAAPEFTGLDGWLNAPQPPTMAGLRGKVVLVNFWTYSCINSLRPMPYIKRWQAEYGALGLQVVGIHTPEFGFERVRGNVEAALRELDIRFPVGQDNGFQTWRAWSNQAWPAFYLIDREGRIVLARDGEGHAHDIEGAIRGLLGLSGPYGQPGDDPDFSRIRSPELYYGAQHPTPQDRAQSPRQGTASYSFTGAGPMLNQYQLDGTWAREGEALTLRSALGGLRLRFSAAKLHLVAGAPEGARLRVTVDGGPARVVEVRRPALHTLLDGEAYGEHLVTVEADAPGLSLFSSTFG